jgi:NAD(P)-dependent dehydrogenase (short-subunit alcohol dehydrogenase family)
VTLDVTSPTEVQAAVDQIAHLDILINNAGLGSYENLADRSSLERHLAVNLLGTYDVTHAFLPLLTASRGAIVNVLSVAALASLPIMPAYSISKAAALSLSQSLRALLASQGVTVHAVLAGPVDTDMVRTLQLPKSSAQLVAQGILDGLERAEDEIFPDRMSGALAESWHRSTNKTLEAEFAAFVQPRPVAS